MALLNVPLIKLTKPGSGRSSRWRCGEPDDRLQARKLRNAHSDLSEWLADVSIVREHI